MSIEAILKQYLALQEQEREIKQQKTALQRAVADHMQDIRKATWYPEIEGQKLSVHCQESLVVTYKEDLLRKRLTDRYPSILAPDPKKMKRYSHDVEPLVMPIMIRVGSPSLNKIQVAIESGMIADKELDGTFKKEVKRLVRVARPRRASRISSR